jgi:hypothetical protein
MAAAGRAGPVGAERLVEQGAHQRVAAARNAVS